MTLVMFRASLNKLCLYVQKARYIYVYINVPYCHANLNIFCGVSVAVLHVTYLEVCVVNCVFAACVYLQLSACELQAAQSVFTALKFSLKLLGPCSSLSGAVQLIAQCTHAPHLTLQRAILQTHIHTFIHQEG